MVLKTEINFYKGDTYTRDIKISGWNRDIDKIYFTVKLKATDKNVVLQKKLNDGITLVEEDKNSKTYNILIEAVDTDNMKPDVSYIFDIEIISGDIKKTIVDGTLLLIGDKTLTRNEV